MRYQITYRLEQIDEQGRAVRSYSGGFQAESAAPFAAFLAWLADVVGDQIRKWIDEEEKPL